MSRTLAIIKPDAVASGHAGKILAHLEREGFLLRSM
ncbi:MAG: nucleoside-diphosphate kinase, partial [Gemmatimonadota bacterium]